MSARPTIAIESHLSPPLGTPFFLARRLNIGALYRRSVSLAFPNQMIQPSRSRSGPRTGGASADRRCSLPRPASPSAPASASDCRRPSHGVPPSRIGAPGRSAEALVRSTICGSMLRFSSVPNRTPGGVVSCDVRGLPNRIEDLQISFGYEGERLTVLLGTSRLGVHCHGRCGCALNDPSATDADHDRILLPTRSVHGRGSQFVPLRDQNSLGRSALFLNKNDSAPDVPLFATNPSPESECPFDRKLI